MGDEHDRDVQRAPLWPPDNAAEHAEPFGAGPARRAPLNPREAAAQPWDAQSESRSISQQRAQRVSAAHAYHSGTHTPQLTPPPRRQRRAPSHRRLWVTLVVIIVLLAGAGGLYAYASSLAAEPDTLVARYCAAITHDDYRTAYGLLSSAAQAQEDEAQYLDDASARDTIEGPVTHCAATSTQNLSPLSFLTSPRSIIFNAQITRKQAASGQMALSRDARGWHVAALSSSLQGIDLGPLTTEQALCKAFSSRAFDQAYALLSTPYQKEQGSAANFAHDFGSTLKISGCAPDLKTYTVNATDQQASMNATLTVSVTGAASPFSLPAKLTLVRESNGWRVDTITPLLTQ